MIVELAKQSVIFNNHSVGYYSKCWENGWLRVWNSKHRCRRAGYNGISSSWMLIIVSRFSYNFKHHIDYHTEKYLIPHSHKKIKERDLHKCFFHHILLGPSQCICFMSFVIFFPPSVVIIYILLYVPGRFSIIKSSWMENSYCDWFCRKLVSV